MAQYPVTPKGGRLPNRLGEQAGAETQTAAPSVDLNEMFGAGSQQQAPANPATETVPAPAEPKEPEKKAPKPKQPKPPKDEKADSKHKKPAKEDSEDFADKDKYSIYLPPKLSMALRMVYISTRKKYSHITEVALTDMLFNRYQCHNPKCTARFSISEGDHTPICCPVCGEKKFSPLRVDLFD